MISGWDCWSFELPELELGLPELLPDAGAGLNVCAAAEKVRKLKNKIKKAGRTACVLIIRITSFKRCLDAELPVSAPPS
jgi:hypothetical protein